MQCEPVHAVIMAGGRGTRLAPYTAVLPKPLMPLNDRPILDVLVRQLLRDGVKGITISVSPLSGLIETWMRHHGRYGIPIDFVYEDAPLGTAGALRNIRRPDSTFLALNGDVLTTLDVRDLIAHNRETGAIATMAIKRRTVDVEYGLVHLHSDGRVDRLEEKPQLAFTVSMGVYAMAPSIVDLIGDGERIDFPDLMVRAMNAGHTVDTLLYDGYWRDIGNPADYEAAIVDFDANPDEFLGPRVAAGTGQARSALRQDV
jgi:NDP-sugar pyrophosphorylase family protein